MVLSNKKIDKTKYNTNIKDIIKYYYQNKTNIIKIVNNIDNREIILEGNKNLKYIYNNPRMFDNIFLPELINFYLTNNIINEEKIERNQYIINNSLYIINYNYLIESIKTYVNTINRTNKYKLDLKNNIELEAEPIKKHSYSYGYINILLISFLISIVTIIICIIR